jgi:UDP-N-acetylglucosamine/UDP-N-acetyl-alpha-D-glucosaminouronate 4-epimerase
MATYLVTGGAGFIGSHLVRALHTRGDKVRVLDNFSTGFRRNLADLPDVEVIEGDVRSYHTVREAVEGVHFVLHQAALPSVPRSIRDPITSNDVNVVGTLNVLNASRDARIARLIYASSSSIYGRSPELPKREDMMPLPISPYAVSKLAGENYCRAFWELYGFETVMLRYFNVFGPQQDPTSQYSAVIPIFISKLLKGEAPVVNGDGSQTRDFTFVDNIVQANLTACQAAGVAGKLFNVAAGSRHSVLELLETLQDITGERLPARFNPSRMGDVPHSYADIGQARELLRYQPTVGFRDGLERTTAAMRSEAVV